MTFFKCIEFPKGNYLYEWTNPQGYVVSQKNVLKIQLLEDSDFGHYVCKAVSELGPVGDRDVFIREDTMERLTQDPMISGKSLSKQNDNKINLKNAKALRHKLQSAVGNQNFLSFCQTGFQTNL